MTISRTALALLACTGLLVACTDEDTIDLTDTAGSGGTSAGASSGGTTSGGSTSGGSTAGGTGGVAGSSAGTAGSGADAGSGGDAGSAGAAGNTSAPPDAGPSDGDASVGGDDAGAPGADASAPDAGGVDAAPLVACGDAGNCDDGNDCTDDVCINGFCSNPPLGSGTACGDATNDECTNPDTCDGAGTCQPNHEPTTTACGDPLDNECTDPDTCDGNGVCANNSAVLYSTCATGICGDVFCEECTDRGFNTVPLTTTWSVAGKADFATSGCSTDTLPDDVILYLAPVTGTYRFEAVGDTGVDPVLTIFSNFCVGNQDNQINCNGDTAGVGGDIGSRIDLALNQGDTITISLNADEGSNPADGGGSLTVELLP